MSCCTGSTRARALMPCSSVHPARAPQCLAYNMCSVSESAPSKTQKFSLERGTRAGVNMIPRPWGWGVSLLSLFLSLYFLVMGVGGGSVERES